MTRRHPLLPFLLLATLALDVLFVYLSYTNIGGFIVDSDGLYKGSCFLGFIAVQSYLLGIWTSSSLRGYGTRMLSSVAIISLLLLLEYFEGRQPIVSSDYAIKLAFSTYVVTVLVKFTFKRHYKTLDLLQIMTTVSVIFGVLVTQNFDWEEVNLFVKALVPQVTFVLLLGYLVKGTNWRRLIVVVPVVILFGMVVFDYLFSDGGMQLSFGRIFGGINSIFGHLSFLYLITATTTLCVWFYSLNLPKQRRKREQAALVKPEQPVRVPNQDVDPKDSSQPTEPDDKANDEPPGPIDLTV